MAISWMPIGSDTRQTKDTPCSFPSRLMRVSVPCWHSKFITGTTEMAKDKPVSITGVAMQDIACIAKTYGNKVVTITEEPNRDFHYRIIYSEDSKMVEDLVYVRGH